jgi:uncharacterized membrane protein
MALCRAGKLGIRHDLAGDAKDGRQVNSSDRCSCLPNGFLQRSRVMNLAVLIAAFGATGMEFAEAAVVVLVVVSRGQRKAALIGTASAGAVVVALAAVLGPKVLGLISLDLLRQLLGGALVLLGCFWLLRAIVRPDAASRELAEETGAANRWAQRGALGAGLISAKAVGIEGAEAAVLVVAIGAPHHALWSATAGAGVAAAVVVILAARIERRLTSLASHTLNRVAGTALLLVGCYWLAEGSHLSLLQAIGVFAGPVVLIAVTRGSKRNTPPSEIGHEQPSVPGK